MEFRHLPDVPGHDVPGELQRRSVKFDFHLLVQVWKKDLHGKSGIHILGRAQVKRDFLYRGSLRSKNIKKKINCVLYINL